MGDSMTILDGLDERQQEVCKLYNEPVLALAGPGSGKTRLLVHSIAYRISKGISPENIAALTFTNKGAKEIKDRVIALCGHKAKRTEVSTYHSFIARKILLPNNKHPTIVALGYEKGLVISTEEDSSTMLNIAMKNVDARTKVLISAFNIKPKDVKPYMSFYRAEGKLAVDHLSKLKQDVDLLNTFKELAKLADQVVATPDNDNAVTELNEFADQNRDCKAWVYSIIWRQFEVVLAQSNAVDFDGMLVVALKVLQSDKALRESLAFEFTHILLDEWQDTNPVQYLIFKEIVKEQLENNLLAVGDIRQIIYRFRNTDATVSIKFIDDFNAKVMTLDMNYRSTPEIIALGNAIGAKIPFEKSNSVMESFQASGQKPRYRHFSSEKDEAKWIVNDINKKLSDGVEPKEIAILYRGKTLKTEVEKILVEEQLPYNVVGDKTFYEKKEIKDCISLLRTLMKSTDINSGTRFIDALNCGIRGLTARFEMMESNRKQLDSHALEYLYDRIKSGKRISKEPGKKDRLINGGKAMRALRNATEEYSKDAFRLSYMKHYISQDQNLSQHTWTSERMIEGFNIIVEANMLDKGVEEKIVTLFTQHIEQFIVEADAIWTQYLLPPLTEYTNKMAKDNPDEVMEERISNVKSLFESLRTNCLRKGSTLSEGIDDLVMLAESETKLEENAIQLLTIHASKGLEFPHTFLIGVEEESFFRTNEPTDEDIESELCTLFVALTRGEKSVTMTQTDIRFINGQWLDRKPLSILLDTKEALDALDMDKYNSIIEHEPDNSDISRLFKSHGL